MIGDDWCILFLAEAVVDWRISILVVQTRDCSALAPSRYYLVYFVRGHPRFLNFNCTMLVDIVGVKSHVNTLLNLPCVPTRVSINKLRPRADSARSHYFALKSWIDIT